MIRILRAVDCRLGGNLLFMFLMAVGAGLSLVRGFGAAVILPAAEFGLYALLVAVAAFVSSIAGFGKIEETRKLFPRMAVDGHGADISRMADRLALLVALRLTLIAVPLCIASIMLLSPAWTAAIFATLLLIFGVAWGTILASALRAGPNLNRMGISAAMRAAVTIILAFAGAYEFGFSGAVCGEAAGAIFGAILMRHYLRKSIFLETFTSETSAGNEKMLSISGIYFFIGSLATAAPIYLGRFLVGVGYSDNILGAYSFLGLLVSSILTVLGISDQMTGPRFVKSERFGSSKNDQISFLRKIILSNVAIIIAICASFFAIIFIPQFPYFREKYQIQIDVVLPLTFYCIFQITTTLDWFLQAHDRENLTAIAAVIHMLIFLVASLIAVAFGVSIIWILWTHAIAKGIQLLMQCSILIARPAPRR